MDVNGLAAAWLSAVQRTRSQPAPGPERPWADQGRLTTVIERALRAGGPDSKEPDWVDPLRPGAAIDLTV
jgi:hypothetical protein